MVKSRHKYQTTTSTKVTSNFEKTIKILLEVFRILVGLVFVFSGFVKAIDPLGSTYKIQDYLNAFGGFSLHLVSLAFPVAIALSTLELLIGLCLLFKIKLKSASISALLFILVMLPLTLYIAIKNPVTDCGCFGDALVITNWQTFFKNVVLFVLILFLVIFQKRMRNLFLTKIEWIFILVFILIGVGLSVYSVRHLPMIDFRPYKINANIPEGMKVPEGKPTDKYDTKLIYEKDGVQQEFTVANYPKNDSTWTFVDQKTTLIEKGFEPPIHNFIITDNQENEVTDDVIYFAGITYLAVMYDVTQADKEGVEKAEKLYKQTVAKGEHFYALTGSTNDDIDKFVSENKITFPLYHTDPITLKTIVRANPGFVEIKDGTIVGKWNWRDFQ